MFESNKNNGFKERRKYTRLDIRSKVKFKLLSSSAQADDEMGAEIDVYNGTSKNLGVGGICFISEKELFPSETIDLEIFLPNRADPVYLEGEVIWCHPKPDSDNKEFDTGVRFLSIDKDYVRLLIKYICGEWWDEGEMGEELSI